jgi:ATP dependent DNA ligase domain
MARAVARSSRAAALPQWVPPQLTQLLDAAPEGDQWLHEIKFDGYRIHARLDRGAVKLLTRTGLDWTHKYPAIAKAVAALPAIIQSRATDETGYTQPTHQQLVDERGPLESGPLFYHMNAIQSWAITADGGVKNAHHA